MAFQCIKHNYQYTYRNAYCSDSLNENINFGLQACFFRGYIFKAFANFAYLGIDPGCCNFCSRLALNYQCATKYGWNAAQIALCIFQINIILADRYRFSGKQGFINRKIH